MLDYIDQVISFYVSSVISFLPLQLVKQSIATAPEMEIKH